MAAAVVKMKLETSLSEDSEVTEVSPTSMELKTSTGGKPMKLNINNGSCGNRPSQPLLSAEDLSKIQNDLSLSNNQVLKLAGHIRSATSSRASIEPCLKDKLLELHHCLDEYFMVESDAFLIRESEKENIMESRPIIHCRDVNSFMEKIMELREKSYTMVKIGLDGGGGFLKVSLTLMTFETDMATSARRRKLADGVAAKTRSEGSVTRVFLLALVPDVPENYRNLLNIWIKLKLDKLNIPITIAADLKLSNLLIGIMAHGSTHPCTWCNVSRDQMLQGQCGSLRTLGNLRQSF